MLAFEAILPKVGEPAKAFVFLHGILGRGANWRSLARRFVQACPVYRALLVDLRRHGASVDVPGPDTVAAAAADLRALPGPIAGLLGHSFGGKVALQYARTKAVEELWLVDSNPGARPDRRGSETIGEVLGALRRAPRRVRTRDEFVRALTPHGLDLGVARWLAMSLRREDDGFAYPVDLDTIEALLDDYFSVDLWPALEEVRGDVHLVVATRSAVFGPEDRRRAHALAARRANVFVHEIDAGHWVHAEAPDVLLSLMIERRPRA